MDMQKEPKKIIRYMALGSNTTYVLDDDFLFLPTEYKVIQSETIFVKCMKMRFNGKIQLFYYTQCFQTLSSLLPNLSGEQFNNILTNLISKITDVRNNGFLCCESLDISPNHIYIEPNTSQVYLLYLPIRERIFSNYMHFEKELRGRMAKTIMKSPALSQTKSLKSALPDLLNQELPLESLYRKLLSGAKGFTPNDYVKSLHLVSMDQSEQIDILINDGENTLGRSTFLFNNGAVDKNISRKHCMISRRGTVFILSDLDSTNGTFLNGIRLCPFAEHTVNPGDVIRLANREFRLEVR